MDEPADSTRVVAFPFAFHSKRAEYAANTAINSALLRIFRWREGFDVVHTQDGELIGGDVVTAHSLLRVVHRTFRKADPNYVSWIPQSPLLWCEDLIYGARRYRHVFASSEKMRQALRDLYRVPSEDVSVIRLGVETARFQPNRAARDAFRRAHGIGEEPVLLHVSTDFERKGLRTIVAALPKLDDSMVLVVAGLGRETPFREQASALGVKNRIVFLGYQEALESVYPAADLFVFPTRLDFFGFPVLEAMACGVPPIVTGNAGVAELIEDGRNGYQLRDPNDPHELASTIKRALGTGRQAVARGARATAEDTSAVRMVEETRRAYEALVRR